MQLSSSRQQWARFPWERRAPARLQKPRWSVAFPGTPHVDTENYMTLTYTFTDGQYPWFSGILYRAEPSTQRRHTA